MVRVDVRSGLNVDERAAVHRLIVAEHRRLGHRPLSDRMWIELAAATDEPSGDNGTFGAILCWADEVLVGYIQFVRVGQSWSIEAVATPDVGAEVQRAAVLDALDSIAARGGGSVDWWVFDVDDAVVTTPIDVGLTVGRVLLQMRTELTATVDTDVETRPFVIDQDEDAWLAVNNAAFAAHAEQGRWDRTMLRARIAEPWFDPSGFLLHERDGRLAAFCWTKMHREAQPVLGEIYVIAVHPDFHGLGLGRALTVAGLASIRGRGVSNAMLYVDAANLAAVGLYRSLGFHVHRTDRAYVATVTAR